MQRHLDALIGVFIVHVVDAVEGVHIRLRQPIEQIVVGRPNRVVVQNFIGQRRGCGRYLLAGDLIAAYVDGVQQRLGHDDASSEELNGSAQRQGENNESHRLADTATQEELGTPT